MVGSLPLSRLFTLFTKFVAFADSSWLSGSTSSNTVACWIVPPSPLWINEGGLRVNTVDVLTSPCGVNCRLVTSPSEGWEYPVPIPLAVTLTLGTRRNTSDTVMSRPDSAVSNASFQLPER